MKEIKENRFQKKKPDEIKFTAPPMPASPPERPKKTAQIKEFSPSVRTNERTTERAEGGLAVNSYVIEIPLERRKIRHAFDIYEDHLDALKKLQLAEREKGRGRGRVKTLGDMAQEALDKYIKEKAKTTPNVHISET